MFFFEESCYSMDWKGGISQDAFEVFNQIKQEDVELDHIVYIRTLQPCTSLPAPLLKANIAWKHH